MSNQERNDTLSASAEPGAATPEPLSLQQQDVRDTKARLVEKVAHQLSRDIIAGIYAPGDPIREPEVSARLGISRAPVREALRILEHEGMIEMIPWRGARVINPTPEQIADLFDLLAAIEGMVVRLAVRHASDDDLERHRDLIEQISAASAKNKTQELFHIINLAYQAAEVLAASCGSPMAASMVRRVSKPSYWLHRFLMPAPPRWVRQSVAKQQALVATLQARDEDRSERAARALVAHTKRLVVLRAREVEEARGILHRAPAWNVQQIAERGKRTSR